MKALSSAINSMFKPAATRPVDLFRKSRSLAQKLALKYGVEIERLRDGGFNVWPPESFVGIDPLDGDHYSIDWDEVLTSVQLYVETIEAEQAKATPAVI